MNLNKFTLKSQEALHRRADAPADAPVVHGRDDRGRPGRRALASRLQARGYPVFLVPALCIVGLLAAKLGLMLQPTDRLAVTALWIAFSAFAAGGATGYVAIGQMFPPELTGRVSTAANMLTLVGAFLLQSAIGWILDLWPRTAAGGWDPRGYSWALALSAALHLVLALRLAAALRRGRAA